MTITDDRENDIRIAKRQRQEIDDLNNEMAGRETGRLSRFGYDASAKSIEAQKRREKEAFQDYVLSAEYQAIFNRAIQTLNETRIAVYDALIEAKDVLHVAKLAHEDLLSKASTLNGEHVFLDDGSAYTEEGRKLSEEEFLNVDWKENSPSWQTYQDSHDKLDAAQERVDKLIRYSHRVDEIDAEVREKPDSIEEVERLTDELHDMRTYADKDYELNQDTTVQYVPESKAGIDMNF